jgi:cytochrome P450
MSQDRPPAPDGLPLLGNSVPFARDPFGFTADAVAEVGDVFRIDLPVGDRYIVAHPDHAEQVLVSERDAFRKTDDFGLAFGDAVIAVDGEAWREQREFLDPFFFARRIQGFLPTMRERSTAAADALADGDRIELLPEMKRVTFDLLASTLLGLDPDAMSDDLRVAADHLNAYFEPATWALPDWVPTPSRRRFRAAKSTLRTEIRSVLADAGGSAPDPSGADAPSDLISTLAGALSGAGGRGAGDGHGGDGRGEAGYPRDRADVVDQLTGLVFAGHETTALALTFTLHGLAERPDLYRRVEAELDDVVGDDPIGWDHLDDLTLLDRVIDETLRQYPPVHSLPRETTRDVAFGDHVVPEGSEVLVGVYAIHHDDRFWDDPDAFDPSRWVDRDRSADAYLPFGAGPRRCLGATFARVEARVVLATLLRRFRFESMDPGELELSPQMTTQPAGPVPMRVRRR